MRSRCLCVRVAAPSADQIVERLAWVAAAEKLVLPAGLGARLAEASGRNLRRALLSLEACRVQQYPFTPDQEVAAPDWELYIQVGLVTSGWVAICAWVQLAFRAGSCTPRWVHCGCLLGGCWMGLVVFGD